MRRRSSDEAVAAHRALVEEQKRARRERLRQVTLFGFAVSLPFHAILLAWLGTIALQRPLPGEGAPITVSLAAFVDEQLTEFPDQFPDTDLAVQPDAAAATESMATIEAIGPAEPNLAVSGPGDLVIGGGAGSGLGGEGLGGGAGSASFFGVSGRGNRFCFIVDVSGSMSEENRFPTAMAELNRAIESLPDNTHFHVIFFSSGAYRPPWQERWVRARRPEAARIRRWISEQHPHGGTFPMPAFHMAYALEPVPDVIFFMTDGIIPNDTPDGVRALSQGSRASRRVVVNTIAFGEEFGHDLLQRIARDTQGTFRYVPTRRP